MNILVLEDDQNRIAWFKAYYPDADIVETAAEAIACLDRTRYRLVFLDHDLGQGIYQDSGPGTGYEVAQKLAELGTPHTVVVIHSWNHAGAKNMLWALPHARHIPFGMFKKEDIDRMVE